MFKYILTILIVFSVLAGLNAQNKDNFKTKTDSVYRYNTGIPHIDSISKYFTDDTSQLKTYSKSDGVSLEKLFEYAIRNNPELKAMQLKIQSGEKLADEKTYLPDPMLEIETDDVMSDFMRVGMINFYVSQMFMFPGKLKLDGEMIKNENTMMDYEKRNMASEMFNMIKMNYIDLYYNEKLMKLNHDKQLLIKNILTAAEIKYSSGRGMQMEVFKAQLEQSKLKNEETILKLRKKNYLTSLTVITKTIFTDTTLFSFTSVEDRLKKYPLVLEDTIEGYERIISYAFNHRADVKVLESKLAVHRTGLELSKLNRFPDFSLKLGYKILPFEEKNAFSFMVGFTLPFAPWTSGKYSSSIEKNSLMIKTVTEELEAKKNTIREEITNLINNMKTAHETMKYYKDVMIPQAENSYKSTSYTYESGMTGIIDILDSYKMYFEARSMYLESENMYLKMLADLEKAAGLNLK
jgi:hypothetical protein